MNIGDDEDPRRARNGEGLVLSRSFSRRCRDRRSRQLHAPILSTFPARSSTALVPTPPAWVFSPSFHLLAYVRGGDSFAITSLPLDGNQRILFSEVP
jgi:hypothetical protein